MKKETGDVIPIKVGFQSGKSSSGPYGAEKFLLSVCSQPKLIVLNTKETRLFDPVRRIIFLTEKKPLTTTTAEHL